MKVNLSGVSLKGNELKYLKNILKTGILSIGKYTEEFEKRVSKFAGRKYGVSVSSGTAGLFLLLMNHNLNENDEVITSPFSFVASSNVIIHAGAVPKFCDIDEHTLCMSAEKLEKIIDTEYRMTNGKLINKKTKKHLRGVLAVDIFGNMCDYKKIERIVKKNGLFLIEDSCEAFGTEYAYGSAGSFGEASVFAFYPNKQITTGEGGMIVTDSKEIYMKMRALRNQGRKDMDLWLDHSYLGYNFRIDELSSAVGVAQMERVEEILDKRRTVAEYYDNELAKIKGVKIPYTPKSQKNGWFVYVIRVNERIRNKTMDSLIKNGISVRPYFTPIHTQPCYNKFGYKLNDFPVTASVSAETIAIPFHTDIKRREQNYVIRKIDEILNT